jgi:vacuolar-type H+-ATPase subunit F/Vma7
MKRSTEGSAPDPAAPDGLHLIYVGSAVRAAGYRLGGFVTLTPEQGQEGPAVESALRQASIVVLESQVAERLPRARLESLLAAGSPPIVIAPHPDGTSSALDPAERVRIQLGLEA